MKLLLIRKWFTPNSTTGELYVDGKHECFTLEDVVRVTKMPGETAIPYGSYPVIINHSNRFKRDMPLLLGVPGFEGVRIHMGNTASDTEGCILVGLSRDRDRVLMSRIAFDALFHKLQQDPDRITLEIIDGSNGRGC